MPHPPDARPPHGHATFSGAVWRHRHAACMREIAPRRAAGARAPVTDGSRRATRESALYLTGACTYIVCKDTTFPSKYNYNSFFITLKTDTVPPTT